MTAHDEPAGTAGDSGRSWRRWSIRVLAAVIVLLGVLVAGWLIVAPDASPGPLGAVYEDPDVVVEPGDGYLVLSSADERDDEPVIVFYPGAGVPAEAYLSTWAPVVEEIGASVIIPSFPLGLAVLDPDVADDVRFAVDGTGPRWIGGHSLGGTMAARHAAANLAAWDGLLLWASYPAGDDLAHADRLSVTSISGTNDGLTTPEDVEASRANLPPETVFVELDGVNHAQFGAYGDQLRDDDASVTDEVARRLIAEATQAALAE